MPQAETVNFGSLEYDDHAVIEFPRGLPAFENERRFVIIEQDSTRPIVFLQSLSRPDLSFMALPANSVDPGYKLMPASEDLEDLGLASDREPCEGKDVVTLALVTVWDNRDATANLMAPVVVNVTTRHAFQVVQPWSGYSHQHRLGAGRPGTAEQAAAL